MPSALGGTWGRGVGEGFMEEVVFQVVLDISLNTQEREGTPSRGNRLGKGTEVCGAELSKGPYWGGAWSYRCETHPKLWAPLVSG